MIDTAATWWLLRELRRGGRQSESALRTRRGHLLQVAVAHAYEQVPFYRRVFDAAGVHPENLRSVDDLCRLPIIDANELRTAIESGELIARSVDATCPRLPTTGSSGAAVLVPRGPTEARLWRAAGLRMLLEHGFRWRHRTVHFDATTGRPHPLQRLGLGRTIWIAPTLPLDQQLARFAAARAQFVVGTPTVLRRICRALAERGIRPHPPRLVLCQGEILDERSRELIRRGLGADPVSVYGMTEVGYIAWQCEGRTTFHVNAELVVVEVVRDGSAAAPGEVGRVVVTDLRSRAMPLLRCDTGDLAIASPQPCPCGRTLPTLASIEGRRRDAIRLGGGRIVTPRAVVNHLSRTLGPDDYRLHHEDEGQFRLEVTPPSAAGEDHMRAERQLRQLLGDVEIRIEVTTLPPGREKTQAVTCDAARPSRAWAGNE